MVPSEGKETQELQEVVFETSSDIYKLEKVVETNEYEIPDLWKLKVAKSQKGSLNIVPSLKNLPTLFFHLMCTQYAFYSKRCDFFQYSGIV